MELGDLNTRFVARTPEAGGQKKDKARPREADPAPLDQFANLSQEQQSQCRDQLNRLASKGRLFKHNPKGGLDPTTAIEAYRGLRSGEIALEDVVVTTSKTTTETKASQNSFYQDYYSGFNTANSHKKDASEETLVGYTTTPVEGWGDLLWLDPELQGIPGAPHLPTAGVGTVSVSRNDIQEAGKRHHYYELNQPEIDDGHHDLDEKSRTLRTG
jgi:hypothetical protein